MTKFLHSPYIKVICCYLALVMAGFLPGPREARASFISHSLEITTELDAESLETIQTVLENELIAEKLSELGLTEEEIIQRVEQLSPDEREIVLEKLENIQQGGNIYDEEFLGFVVLLGIVAVYAAAFVVAALLYLIFKGVSGGTGNGGGKELQGPRDKGINFYKTSDSDFPSYKGEVEVLVNEEPQESSILIGWVYIIEKKTKDKLLGKMKKKAAKHGADTIILFTSDPEQTESDNLYWSARAFKTPGGEVVE